MSQRRAAAKSIIVTMLSIITVAGVVALVFVVRSRQQVPEQPLTVIAFEGPFESRVMDQGTIESSKNISIVCEIESVDYDGTPILEVMDEGTEVKPGDVVTKFDPKQLKDKLSERKIRVNDAAAKVAASQSALDAAEQESVEYFSPEDGMYTRDETQMITAKLEAKRDLEQAKEYLEFSRRMKSRGFMTDSQYRQDEQTYEQKKSNLKLTEINLKLLERTSKRKKIEFDSKIAAAEVTLENAEKSYRLELKKQAEVESQIEKCVVVVPEGVTGKLVYPDRWDHRSDRKFVMEPGAKLREKQEVVLIPNPRHMQVKASVNESRIVAVKEGLPVSIKIDALPDTELKGVVERVGQFAEDKGWRSNGVNEYPVTIKIKNPPDALRSGMNASISIEVERRKNAIQIPFLAISERNDKFYCIVQQGEEWVSREVKINSQNDKMVCIDKGIKKGDVLALNPDGYEELAGLPKRIERISTPEELQQESEEKATEEAASQSEEQQADDSSSDAEAESSDEKDETAEPQETQQVADTAADSEVTPN